MKTIGVTGSSGSGKTTVCKILNKRADVEIIDADSISREMQIPGNEYYEKIKERFGDKIILEDGNINREALAMIIYNDDEAREDLNSLTFKYVNMGIKNKIKALNDTNLGYAVIDASLLYESGLDKLCDYVIALISDKKLKIQRICQRDGISPDVAMMRLNIQQDDSFYEDKADILIKNKSDKDSNLEKELKRIFSKLDKMK